MLKKDHLFSCSTTPSVFVMKLHDWWNIVFPLWPNFLVFFLQFLHCLHIFEHTIPVHISPPALKIHKVGFRLLFVNHGWLGWKNMVLDFGQNPLVFRWWVGGGVGENSLVVGCPLQPWIWHYLCYTLNHSFTPPPSDVNLKWKRWCNYSFVVDSQHAFPPPFWWMAIFYWVLPKPMLCLLGCSPLWTLRFL